MNAGTRTLSVDGPAGAIDVALDLQRAAHATARGTGTATTYTSSS